jgi:hypothetical protein
VYVAIPFWRLLLALVVIAVPAAALEGGGERHWARAYVVLILLIFLLGNWQGVVAFGQFLQRELNR